MSEMTLPQANGQPSSAAESWERQAREIEQGLETHLAELRVLLAGEQQLAEQIRATLDGCREREKRIERAIAALDGNARPTGRPPRAKPALPSAQAGGQWRVSDRKLEEVRATLERLGSARRSEIVKASGVSDVTVGKALAALRERDVVRVVAHDAKRGPMFALMPTAGTTPDA